VRKVRTERESQTKREEQSERHQGGVVHKADSDSLIGFGVELRTSYANGKRTENGSERYEPRETKIVAQPDEHDQEIEKHLNGMTHEMRTSARP